MIGDSVKDKNIKEEGERMVPAFHRGNLVYGEHVSRYESVRGLLEGKIVLDIASGSGYGTHLLSEKAKKIYGVEVDKDAVEYSKRNYGGKNIEYLLGDAESIPLGDDSVDVVVTFETIEHIKDYKKFLNEIKRILKPGGFAIISTPNDPEFPEGNHFHLHEFEESELSKLISSYFKNQKFYYQYTWIAAGVVSGSKASKEQAFDLRTVNVAPVLANRAIYFMVVCSDSAIDKLVIKDSVFLSQHFSARKLQEDDIAKKKYVDYLESEVRKLHKKNGIIGAEITAVNQRATSLAAQLDAIHATKSWKAANKLRSIKKKLK